MSELWTLWENNAKLFSLNKAFSVIVIISLNCPWMAEDITRKTHEELKFLNRRVQDFQEHMIPEILFPNILKAELQQLQS